MSIISRILHFNLSGKYIYLSLLSFFDCLTTYYALSFLKVYETNNSINFFIAKNSIFSGLLISFILKLLILFIYFGPKNPYCIYKLTYKFISYTGIIAVLNNLNIIFKELYDWEISKKFFSVLYFLFDIVLKLNTIYIFFPYFSLFLIITFYCVNKDLSNSSRGH